jgi:hypothetical protein
LRRLRFCRKALASLAFLISARLLGGSLRMHGKVDRHLVAVKP